MCDKNEILLCLVSECYASYTSIRSHFNECCENDRDLAHEESGWIIWQVLVHQCIPMWTRASKIKNAIKGFKKSGILPCNPQVIKTGKLAPSSIHQKPDSMLVIENSFVEPAESQPLTSAEGPTVIDNHKKSNEVEVKMFGNELLWLTLCGKMCRLVAVTDDGPESKKKDAVKEILKVPQAKVSLMGRAQMSPKVHLG